MPIDAIVAVTTCWCMLGRALEYRVRINARIPDGHLAVSSGSQDTYLAILREESWASQSMQEKAGAHLRFIPLDSRSPCWQHTFEIDIDKISG